MKLEVAPGSRLNSSMGLFRDISMQSKSTNHRRSSDTAQLQPIKPLQIEISDPDSVLAAVDMIAASEHYQVFRALIRIHTWPVGQLDFVKDACLQDTSGLYAKIWTRFQNEINEHLIRDGCAPLSDLTATSCFGGHAPRCLQKRSELLKAAPLVSVIVPTRDRTRELRNCLNHLLKLEYPSFEVIVVDNAPTTSATADLVKSFELQFGKLIYVREDRPGNQWARNSGIRHARGKHIAFTDDDAIVDSHWLTALVDTLESASDIACATGLALPAELDTPAQLYFEQFGGFNKGRGYARILLNLTNNRPLDPLFPYIPSKFGAGVNNAYRADVLRELNGFDPAFVTGQDIDLYFRVIAAGHTLVIEPSAIVWHFHRREYQALANQLYRYGTAFSSFLTKCILDNPGNFLELARRIPYAVPYLFDPNSVRNQNKRKNYPVELTLSEIRGMLFGPAVYLRNRRIAKRLGADLLPLDSVQGFPERQG